MGLSSISPLSLLSLKSKLSLSLLLSNHLLFIFFFHPKSFPSNPLPNHSLPHTQPQSLSILHPFPFQHHHCWNLELGGGDIKKPILSLLLFPSKGNPLNTHPFLFLSVIDSSTFVGYQCVHGNAKIMGIGGFGCLSCNMLSYSLVNS